MNAAKKFTFGTDFREGGRRAVSDADLAAARAEGFAAGQEQGRREADAQMHGLLGHLVRSVERLLVEEDKRAFAIEEQAAQLALVTAQALAGAALDERPLARIEKALRDCLGHARFAPHLVVRVHESVVETMESMLAGLARETGFAGRLVVLGQPDIAPGDGRIEWADGGMVIDSAAIGEQIEQAVRGIFGPSAKFTASQGGSP